MLLGSRIGWTDSLATTDQPITSRLSPLAPGALTRYRRFLGQRGFFGGQREEERRAFLHAALHAHRSVVRAHQVLHDGKPQPGAAQLPRARLVNAVEPFEQPRQILGRNAGSAV